MSGFDLGANVYEKVYPRPWVGGVVDWAARERAFFYVESIVNGGIMAINSTIEAANYQDIQHTP